MYEGAANAAYVRLTRPSAKKIRYIINGKISSWRSGCVN
jgi:hypothetical protein